jgi:hypothetical protein
MRRRSAQAYLPGFEPRGHRVASLDDAEMRVRIEEITEQAVGFIDVLRPGRKPGAPIEMADVIACRRDVVLALRAQNLPVPDDAWLDALIIELAGWWHGHPLADDVPKPEIEVAEDKLRKPRPPDFNDGLPPVGWDWREDY